VRDDSTRQSVLFDGLFDKRVVAQFDQPHGSSDGGAVLLKALDERLGLSKRLAQCIQDKRQPGKIEHTIRELIQQRMFGIACGYADCNDAARLAHDPIQKMLVGRDPVQGEALASQPTLSRLENKVGFKTLYRMGETLADAVIERQRRRLRGKARRITIELDPTDDPTHGAQQLTLFNSHYDTWCYLPVAGFVQFDDEAEQYLFAYVLRAGTAPAKLGAIGLLRRVFERLRAAFPKARLRVRLDGGFANPEILAFLETERVEYVVAMAGNAVLNRLCEASMKRARALSGESGQTEHVYTEVRYAAQSWTRQRRIVVKAEVVCIEGREPRDNARFVITNLATQPQRLYEDIYCQRAHVELRIKELHHGLEIDRTSCTRFWANQFRVLLTAAAYVLMQELRTRAAGTGCARAQVSTLRERLLKLGVWITCSVRRVVLHLPQSAPWYADWRRIALRLGAVAS
jgi:Transposase DDE domain group 1